MNSVINLGCRVSQGKCAWKGAENKKIFLKNDEMKIVVTKQNAQ